MNSHADLSFRVFWSDSIRLVLRSTFGANQSGPLESAWRLGRLLNEMECRLQLMWVRGSAVDDRELSYWAELDHLLKNHSSDPQAHSFLRGLVTEMESVWRDGLSSLSRSETLEAIEDDVKIAQEHDVVIVANSTRWICEWMRSSAEKMEAFCSLAQVEIQHLAILVDQAIHPQLERISLNSSGTRSAGSGSGIRVP